MNTTTAQRFNLIMVVKKSDPSKFKSFTNIQNATSYLDSKNRKAGFTAYELVAA